MDLDQLCKGELCVRAFELIAVGAPSIIALFLIVYAHKTLSSRLKEASEAEQPEDAAIYRVQLNRVWTVALLLLLAHAGIFGWRTFDPPDPAHEGYIAGAFRDFDGEREIDLESQPARLYLRSTPGADRYWVITGSPKMARETFRITSEGTRLTCPVDLSNLTAEEIADVPAEMQFQLRKGADEAGLDHRLHLIPSHLNISWECITQIDDVPPEQPSNGGPLDVHDATAGAEEREEHSWLAPLFGVARAGSVRSKEEQTLNDLESDDYRVRHAARQVIAGDFEPYRDWAEYIAREEIAFQAGEGKYRRPSYRSRLGLVYALSRRHAIPRAGLMAPPDLSDAIIEFALEQAVIDDKHLRASAKRFAISYPGPEMEARLEAIWSRAVTKASAPQASETDKERAGFARELMAHFRYNRGVLIILARRDGIDGMPPSESVLDELLRAENLAREIPGNVGTFELAKIQYGIGWAHVVGSNERMAGQFSEDAAKDAFRDALSKVNGREKEYPYAWQIDLMEQYIDSANYGLFNK